MKHFAYLFLGCLYLFIAFVGCREDDQAINVPIDLLIGAYDNIPVIVNAKNSYTFTLSASSISYNTEDNLTFDNDSLVVTVTLTNAYSSNSYFTIYDSNNSEILSETLNENKVIVNTEFGIVTPNKIKIELSEFSGNLTIVVASKKK